MNDDDILRYVQAAAVTLELPLDADAARRVAGHLARSAVFARQLDAAGLDVDDEPAEIFCPAPFPLDDPA